jgi:hypothetical protein
MEKITRIIILIKNPGQKREPFEYSNSETFLVLPGTADFGNIARSVESVAKQMQLSLIKVRINNKHDPKLNDYDFLAYTERA